MEPEPLFLTLEFGRVLSTGDPYEFQFTPQDYFLRLGQGNYDSAHFPWTEELRGDLEAVRLPGRNPSTVQRLGDTLRRFLVPTGWGLSEAQILSAVAARRPVFLTVRSRAAELYALPWELMTLRPTGQHLGELPSLFLRYEWPEITEAPEDSQCKEEGGRILFAWSASAGAVPASEHLAGIARACDAAAHSFLPERDVLSHVSCGRLMAALEQAVSAGPPISVLHLLCHGARQDSSFGLSLHGESPLDENVVVDAARLRQLLAPFAGMLRLVVISACDSGNSGAFGNHLGSVAQELHRARIAHVVASRYPLSIDGSVGLTETFYEQLLGGSQSVEQAFSAARRRLALDATELDWASLQLYSASQEEGRPIRFRPYRSISQRQSSSLPPSMSTLREAIVQPALRVGLRLDPGLCERLLVDVENQPGALPLLQQTLDLLWQRRQGSRLTQDAYDAMGGCDGALHAHADALIDSLSPEEERHARHLLLWLGSGFTTEQPPTPRRLALSALRPREDTEQAVFDRVLSRLGNERLLVISRAASEKGPPVDLVEVSHETLLRKWPRLLAWVEKERPMLAVRENLDTWVLEWRQRGVLLKGSQLSYAGEAAKKFPQALSVDARELLVQSERAQKEEEELKLRGVDTLRMLAAQSAFGADRTRIALALCETRSTSVFGIPGWLETAIDILHNQVLCIAEVEHNGALFDARFSPDGKTLVLGCQDGTVQLWADGAHSLRAFLAKALPGPITRVSYSPDGTRILALCGDGMGRVLDASSGTELVHLSGHKDSVDAGVWSRDGRLVATASADKTARLFDAETGKQLAVLSGHEGAVVGVALSPDAQRIFTACQVGAVRVFSKEERGKWTPEVLFEEESELRALAISPDGTRLATGSSDGSARVYEIANLAQPTVLSGHNDIVWLVAFSPDGDQLLTCSDDQTARLWNLLHARPPCLLLGHKLAVYSCAFSRNGEKIVTASSDGRARIWDATRAPLCNPKPIKSRAALPGNFKVCAERLELDAPSITSADGKYGARLASERAVVCKQLAGQGTSLTIHTEPEAVRGMRFTLDGTQLVVIAEQRICVADLHAGQVRTFAGHTLPITCFDLSADSAFLVTGAEDWTARVFALRGSGEPRVLSGHEQTLSLVLFNPSGDAVLTVENEGATRLWPTWGPPLVLLSANRPDHAVAISASWQEIVTESSEDERAPLYLWDLDLQHPEVQRRLLAATKLELSDEEYRSLYLRKGKG